MATITTNFGLNIVEGTDIVNPLIYDNPNYQKIDEQMFKNQNAGIQKANYAKSGTVHQITRSIQSANVFYFIASANFNVGDTFSVDGGAVTATLPDGTGLQTNAFVINANVVCVLNGTVLTVLVPNTNPENVEFSETTGKLKTPVNIGAASFDGTASITTDQIGAMNITPETFSATLTVTGGSATLNLNKFGKLIMCDIYGILTFNANTGIRFKLSNNIPTQFLPKIDTYAPVTANAAQNMVAYGYVQISTNGSVTMAFNAQGTAGTNCRFFYIVD